MNDEGVPDFTDWIGTTAQNWTWIGRISFIFTTSLKW
jgi:hypothetical protein